MEGPSNNEDGNCDCDFDCSCDTGGDRGREASLSRVGSPPLTQQVRAGSVDDSDDPTHVSQTPVPEPRPFVSGNAPASSAESLSSARRKRPGDHAEERHRGEPHQHLQAGGEEEETTSKRRRTAVVTGLKALIGHYGFARAENARLKNEIRDKNRELLELRREMKNADKRLKQSNDCMEKAARFASWISEVVPGMIEK